jgi:uncharacterized protein (TIGR02246 family)
MLVIASLFNSKANIQSASSKENGMHAKSLFPASLAVVFLAGCTPATPPAPTDTHVADTAAIRRLESDWNQAESTKDVDKITAFYADDASLYTSGMPAITGKANIVAFYKTAVADKNFSFTWPPSTVVVVSKSGDMAYTEGTYTFTYTDSKTKKGMTEKGKYLEVYTKQADGSWKDEVDSGIPDGPGTPMKTAQ